MFGWQPSLIVLTYAEALRLSRQSASNLQTITQNSNGTSQSVLADPNLRGILTLRFVDAERMGGDYTLYVQVEPY